MNRIRELRKARGMTQEELTVKLRVQRQTLSKYETGAIPLTDDTINILTDFFGVSTDYLLGKSNDPTPPGAKSPVYDKEALELMEELHKRPELKILFRASKHVKRESIEAINQIMQKMAEIGDEEFADDFYND